MINNSLLEENTMDILMKDLAQDMDVCYTTLFFWMGGWRLNKFVFNQQGSYTKPCLQVKLTKEFYKNMCTFLKSRKNPKYLDNFKSKFGFLER